MIRFMCVMTHWYVCQHDAKKCTHICMYIPIPPPPPHKRTHPLTLLQPRLHTHTLSLTHIDLCVNRTPRVVKKKTEMKWIGCGLHMKMQSRSSGLRLSPSLSRRYVVYVCVRERERERVWAYGANGLCECVREREGERESRSSIRRCLVCVCVCVCVRERERDRNRQGDRDREGETELKSHVCSVCVCERESLSSCRRSVNISWKSVFEYVCVFV